ncbi:MAG: Rossmann-like and DUF2520 domain-containing protein [Bacteroidota bacterium]
MKYYDVAIIGAGNLAWSLAPALENAGHRITEIWSRSRKHALELADCLYNTNATDSLDLSVSTAEIFILCIPDDGIEDTVKRLSLPPDSVLAHTSGARSIDILNFADAVPAVLYPLQSFSRSRQAEFSSIPICIEAHNDDAMKIVKGVALSLSRAVYIISSAERKLLHVGAVFACNFTNHLYAIAENLLESENLPFEILHPLMKETLLKAIEMGPIQAQTGPAIRNDRKTMQEHADLLVHDPEILKLYKELSDSIIRNA